MLTRTLHGTWDHLRFLPKDTEAQGFGDYALTQQESQDLDPAQPDVFTCAPELGMLTLKSQLCPE